MTLLIEGRRSFHLASTCAMVGEDNDQVTAWAAAKDHITIRPDASWLMGHFVEADRPNQNGHLFGLEDLAAAHASVVHRPLNMGHRELYNVGTFVATELLFPTAAPDGTPAAAAVMDHPYVEALAQLWKNRYPTEHMAILTAARMGASFFSMEAVPESMTCLESPGGTECGETFAFKGLYHEDYCAHMEDMRSKKRLNKPRYIGGAVIIPPVRPGWRNAEMSEVAAFEAELVRRHASEADAIFAHMHATAGHLSDGILEQMMVELLATAFPAGARG